MKNSKPKDTIINKEEYVDNTKGRCRQQKCSHFQKGTCQTCDSCHSPPLILGEGCNQCLECANIPNNLRWGDGESFSEMRELEQNVNEEKDATKILKEALTIKKVNL